MQDYGIETELLLFITAYAAPVKAKQTNAVTSTAVTIGISEKQQ